MSDLVLIVLTLLVMLFGMVGVLVPILPGLLFVWGAGVTAAFVIGVDGAWWLAGTLTVLFVVATVLSLWLPTRRGLRGDVARSSLLLAGAAGIVGFTIIPGIGLLLGALGGLYAGELRRHRDPTRARAATLEVLRGYGWGVVVELVSGVMMIVTWFLWTLFAR